MSRSGNRSALSVPQVCSANSMKFIAETKLMRTEVPCCDGDAFGLVTDEVVSDVEAPEFLRDSSGLLLRVVSSRASITRLTSL